MNPLFLVQKSTLFFDKGVHCSFNRIIKKNQEGQNPYSKHYLCSADSAEKLSSGYFCI